MTQPARILMALAAVAATCVALPSTAYGGVGASAAPAFPITIELGDTNVPASIEIRNGNSDDPDPADPAQDTGYTNTVCNEGDGFPCTPGERGITLVPTCGLIGAGTTCDPNGADPGVFVLSSTATGSDACAGIDFDVTIIDAAIGLHQFTPTLGRNVTLPGAGAQCVISFTFDVVKLPTVDVNPNAAGVQTAQIVTTDQIVEQASDNHVVPAEGNGTSVRQVLLAQPAIATTASPNTRLGVGQLTDTAIVSGRFNPDPAATIDFRLYGPDDATCSNTPIFESLGAAQSVADGPITSAPYAPTVPGVHRWVASYSGDSNNLPIAGTCNDATEVTTVDRAAPTLATQASADATIDAASLVDTAVVTGRFAPTASTIDFRLYGPTDATCSNSPVFESLGVAYPIAGGNVTSAAFTPPGAGTYRWIATYSGDDTNEPVTGTCADATETTTINRVTPILATTASDDIEVDSGTLVDTAVVTGRFAPKASTISFRLYGPDDATCSNTPIFESLGVVYPIAGGVVSSAPFAPTAVGTYRWVATYSGDTTNESVAGSCEDANETSVVSGGMPTLSATAAPSVKLGAGVLTSTAQVDGRALTGTGGTVDFRLYGPDDTTCSEPPVFESLGVTIGSSGASTSAAFTPQSPGTFRWIVSYSGDDKNAPTPGSCNEPGLSTVVAPAMPPVSIEASPLIALGEGTVSATADVSGRVNPAAGATLQFRLYGPNDATCTGTPIFTSDPIAYPVGGGPVTSPEFTPLVGGTYRWIATYSGDANNAEMSSACADPDAVVSVTPRLENTLPATGTTTNSLLAIASTLILLGLGLVASTSHRRTKRVAQLS